MLHCQALYHKPLAKMIAIALPVFDIYILHLHPDILPQLVHTLEKNNCPKTEKIEFSCEKLPVVELWQDIDLFYLIRNRNSVELISEVLCFGS